MERELGVAIRERVVGPARSGRESLVGKSRIPTPDSRLPLFFRLAFEGTK